MRLMKARRPGGFGAVGTQNSHSICCGIRAPHTVPGHSCEITPSQGVTTCVPYMDSATGVSSPIFQPFNTFTIHKPDCCTLTVTTDAGTITIPASVPAYSSCKFDCDLTFITIEGDCVDSTTIFVNGETTITSDEPPEPCTPQQPPYDPTAYNNAAFPCKC